MRPKPELRLLRAGPDKRTSRAAPAAFTSLLLASVVFAGDALAQVSAGAERYEVTITPPRRPGSEPSPESSVSPDSTGTAAEAAPEPGPPGQAASAGADASPAPDAPGPDGAARVATTPPGASPIASARPAASLPLRTLQVGAFRQKGSATALRDKLAASFPDVSVAEVQSGGDPLYRVYVGRLSRSAALDEIRKRLVAAGHPAFEVPAPTVSVAD